jgi:protein TIF31
MPADTAEARLVRDQALYRLTSAFVRAAAQAAVAVVHGNTVTLDPTEAKENQIFLVNNIFLAHASCACQTQPSIIGAAAAHVAASKERLAVAAIESVRPPGVSTLLNAVIDFAGHRIIAQAIIPGACWVTPVRSVEAPSG